MAGLQAFPACTETVKHGNFAGAVAGMGLVQIPDYIAAGAGGNACLRLYRLSSRGKYLINGIDHRSDRVSGMRDADPEFDRILDAGRRMQVSEAIGFRLERGRGDVADRFSVRVAVAPGDRVTRQPAVRLRPARPAHRGRRPGRWRDMRSTDRATATNVYLMQYPQPLLTKQLASNPDALRSLWQGLNSISRENLLGNGRVYGGGMHKLEPRELANVPVDELAALVGLGEKHTPRQLELAETVAA